jgi:hypothetical protein
MHKSNGGFIRYTSEQTPGLFASMFGGCTPRRKIDKIPHPSHTVKDSTFGRLHRAGKTQK